MAITAAMVKELRERTGLGMMDCKNALQEADGDMEQAIEELRKRNSLKAAKKAGRTTADGLLGVKVAEDGSRGAIIEVNIETDFAAKNEKFIKFVDDVLTEVFESGVTDVSKLLEGDLGKAREALVQEIGENVNIRRAEHYVSDGGFIASYLHSDKRKGALVELAKADAELGRDIAMHVTAIAPMVVQSADVSADVLDKEREIYTAQAAESGKPEDIVAKMVEGRVRKFLAEVSLVDQPFVKDSAIKVGNLLSDSGNSASRFVRFEVGEGIEVEATDFAAEVAAQISGEA